jgi:penicillin-binding protein 1A
MATTPTASPNRRKKKVRFYKRKGFWLGFSLLVLIVGTIGFIAAERYTRPFRERAETYDLTQIGKVEVPSIILGRDGGEIGRIFVQNRSIISINDVPKDFIDALRAGEDKRFFDHDGVDYLGIVRAGIDWISVGEAVSGASTITQQLARGAFDLEEDRKRRKESGIQRKLVEAFLARRIEKTFKKNEILEFYLNRIYFGSGYYGLRSASLGYFGKEPRDLTKLESATLVGLIKNPTGLSPLNNKDASAQARNMVIERMINLGIIDSAEGARMRASAISLNPKPLQRGTSHLYERIAVEIRTLLGDDALAAGGYTIRTSIDSRVQRAAERKLEAMLVQAESHQSFTGNKRGTGNPKSWLQGAVLMVDHRNGAVIAHVGGRDYASVPFDMIELGRRPLGTAFHPFVPAAALENGQTPATQIEDGPMDNRAVMVGSREGILGEWGMETVTPRYEGEITLRRALEASKVAATVRVANTAGIDKVVSTAAAFGLPMQDVEALPRVAVGWEAASLREAVRAYAAFARAGRPGPDRVWFVQSVRDADGGVVFDRPVIHHSEAPAVSDATAFQIHSMLQGSMTRGSAAGVLDSLTESPFNGACKTGTTHDFSDNWMLGYNGRVTCGVWIGYLESVKPIYEGAFSRDLAMPVWAETMNAAASEFGGRSIPMPDSVAQLDVCRTSGDLSTPYCYEMVRDSATGESRSTPTTIQEYFRKGTEKLPFCPVHSGSAPVEEEQRGQMLDMSRLAVIDTSPVRPKGETLVGEDPYHSVHGFAEDGKRPRVRGTQTNVLDSFDVEDSMDGIELPPPSRLEISPE